MSSTATSETSSNSSENGTLRQLDAPSEQKSSAVVMPENVAVDESAAAEGDDEEDEELLLRNDESNPSLSFPATPSPNSSEANNDEQQLTTAVSTKPGIVGCALCQLRIQAEKLPTHININHFSFMRFRCSNCETTAPNTEMIVTHAMERGHSIEVIDECKRRPYMNKLLAIIAEHSQAVTRANGNASEVISSLDLLMTTGLPFYQNLCKIAREQQLTDLDSVTCLICLNKFTDEQILGHVSVKHFDFIAYRCPDCSHAAPYLDQVLKHAMANGHTVNVIDESARKPYVSKLVRLVVWHSRLANVAGNADRALADLDKLSPAGCAAVATDADVCSSGIANVSSKTQKHSLNAVSSVAKVDSLADKEEMCSTAAPEDSDKASEACFAETAGNNSFVVGVADSNLDESSESDADDEADNSTNDDTKKNSPSPSKARRRREKYPVFGRARKRPKKTKQQQGGSQPASTPRTPSTKRRGAVETNNSVESRNSLPKDGLAKSGAVELSTGGSGSKRSRLEVSPIATDSDIGASSSIAERLRKRTPKTPAVDSARSGSRDSSSASGKGHSAAAASGGVKSPSKIVIKMEHDGNHSVGTILASPVQQKRTGKFVTEEHTMAAVKSEAAFKAENSSAASSTSIDCSICCIPMSRGTTIVSKHVWEVHCSKLPFACGNCDFRACYLHLIKRHHQQIHPEIKKPQYTALSEDLRSEYNQLFPQCFPSLSLVSIVGVGDDPSGSADATEPANGQQSKKHKRKSDNPQPSTFSYSHPTFAVDAKSRLIVEEKVVPSPSSQTSDLPFVDSPASSADSFSRDVKPSVGDLAAEGLFGGSNSASKRSAKTSSALDRLAEKLMAKAPDSSAVSNRSIAAITVVKSEAEANATPVKSAVPAKVLIKQPAHEQQQLRSFDATRLKATCQLCGEAVSTVYDKLSAHVWREHCPHLPFTCGLCGHQDVEHKLIIGHSNEEHEDMQPVVMPPPDELKANFSQIYKECFCASELNKTSDNTSVHSGSASTFAAKSPHAFVRQSGGGGGRTHYPTNSRQSKLLQCTMCDRKVLRSSSTKHSKTHLSRNSYECPYCPFGSRGNLYDVQTHVQVTHPDQEARIINHSAELQEEVNELKRRCFPDVPWIGSPRSGSSAYAENDLPTMVKLPPKPFSRFTAGSSSASRAASSRRPMIALRRGGRVAKRRRGGEMRTRHCFVCRKETSYGSSKRHVFAHLFRNCSIARYECEACNYRTCWLETMTNHVSANVSKGTHPAQSGFRDNSDSLKLEYDDMFDKCFPDSQDLATDSCAKTAPATAASSHSQLGGQLHPSVANQQRYVSLLFDSSDPDGVSQSAKRQAISARSLAVKREAIQSTLSDSDQLAAKNRKPGAWTPQFCDFCKKKTDSGGWSRHLFFHMYQDANIARYECSVCGYRTPWSFMIKNHCKKRSLKQGHPAEPTYYDHTDALQPEFQEWRRKCYPGFEPEDGTRAKARAATDDDEQGADSDEQLGDEERAEMEEDDDEIAQQQQQSSLPVVQNGSLKLSSLDRPHKSSASNAAANSHGGAQQSFDLANSSNAFGRSRTTGDLQAKIKCGICEDYVMPGNSSLQYHVWKKHCSQLPFGCSVPGCNYRDVYASGIKSHSDSRHRGVQARVESTSAALRLEYTEMYKACFNGSKPVVFSTSDRASLGDCVSLPVVAMSSGFQKSRQSLPASIAVHHSSPSSAGPNALRHASPSFSSRSGAAETSDFLSCGICNKSVTRRSTDTHIKSHLSQQIFKCSYCSYGSRTHLGDVRAHMEKIHSHRPVKVINHVALYQQEISDLKAQCFPTLNSSRSVAANSSKNKQLEAADVNESLANLKSEPHASWQGENADASSGRMRWCHVCSKETGWRNWRPHVYSHLFKECNLARFECNHCNYRTSWSYTMTEHAQKNANKNTHPDKCSYRDNTKVLSGDFSAMGMKCFGSLSDDSGDEGADQVNGNLAEDDLAYESISAQEFYGMPATLAGSQFLQGTSSSAGHAEEYDEGAELQKYYDQLGNNAEEEEPTNADDNGFVNIKRERF